MTTATEASRLALRWDPAALVSFQRGDCLDLLATMPPGAARLVVTSPPYNIGKAYEESRTLEEYVAAQARVIEECVRVMAHDGSLCWQTGNYVRDGEIVPLDALLFPIFRNLGLKMRNRIVWHFEHGLHCTKRLSGRYETISWFTKSDDYVFTSTRSACRRNIRTSVTSRARARANCPAIRSGRIRAMSGSSRTSRTTTSRRLNTPASSRSNSSSDSCSQ